MPWHWPYIALVAWLRVLGFAPNEAMQPRCQSAEILQFPKKKDVA
jgi:hypothetical protein